MKNLRFSSKTYVILKNVFLYVFVKLVFGNDLSSFEEKFVKRQLHRDYHLVKIYLIVKTCGKRSFQPENVRFCEKWFLAMI